MIDKIIIKNISSLFSLRIAGYVIPLLTLPYLVRILGPKDYGYLAFSQAFVMYVTVIVNYGFDLSATGKVARFKNYKFEKIYVSKLFWNVLSVRLIASSIFYFVFIASTYVSDMMRDNTLIISCCYISVLGGALFPQWIFQGKEDLAFVSIVRIIGQSISIPLIFMYVESVEDLWKAGVILSLPSLSAALFSLWLVYKKNWVVWRRPTYRGSINELKDGWPLFISSAAVSLYTTSVTMIIGFVSGPTNVAIYSSANKLYKAANGLYTPITSAYFPRINSTININREKTVNLIQHLLKIQILITSFISCSMFFLSDVVVNILFGPQYSGSSEILKIMSPLPIIVGLSNVLGVQTLITHGYKSEFSKAIIYCSAASLAFLLPLIYFYAETGAAYAVLLTEIIVLLTMFNIVLKKKIRIFSGFIK